MADSPDKTDWEILYHLTTNARRPSNVIAKEAGISGQLFNYRVSRMVKKGVLSGFNTLVNLDCFGMGIYRVLMRIENANEKRKKEIESYFVSNNSVLQLVSIVGSWDISVNYLARSSSAFHEELKKAIRLFPENLRQYTAMSLTKSIYFNRGFLSKNPEPRMAFLYKGDIRSRMVDAKDSKILRQLFLDARASNFAISRKTGISMNTIKSRLKSMEKRGIIQAYSAFLRPMSFGIVRKKIMIRSNNPVRTEQLLHGFALSNPHVYVLDRMNGRWDFELVLEAFGHREFRTLVQRMRDAISDVPFDYEMVDIAYNHDMNFKSILL